MPLSRVKRPTKPTTVASAGRPNRSRASARVGRTSSAKRETSMPLPEPPPITSPRPGSISPSRSPTAIRLRQLKITWFAQRIATHSNDRNRRRRQPVAVSKRNPRTTYTRTGTRHSQAASIPSSPAFGVDAFTIAGRSRRISRVVAHSARRSATGDGSRTKGRCSTRTPSSHLPGSGGSSGADAASGDRHVEACLDQVAELPAHEHARDLVGQQVQHPRSRRRRFTR